MRFGNPILLLGLLAIVVPIIVHLVNRQRARRQPFPAMAFLLKSNEKLARRLKIKQWLLLALRVSVFALLPLAMARPAAQCGGSGTSSDGRLPTSVVLVVDDSGSMSTVTRGDSAWTDANDRAERVLRDLRAWDQAAVVIASARPEPVSGDPTEERRPVRDALASHAPVYGPSDLSAALATAVDLQRASRLPQQRTVVLSDGTAAAWPDEVDPEAWAGLGDLQFESLDIGEDNCAITDLTWGRAEDAESGTMRFDAAVRCVGDAPARVELSLRADDVPAASAVASVVDGQGTGTFAVRLEGEDPVAVRVSLAQTAGPVVDDDRWAAWVPERRVRVLAVNGDPRAVAYNDELFYLRRALQAGAEQGRDAALQVVPVEGLGAADLASFDVVVLANVGSIPAAQVTRLEQFVASGGGLLMSAGSQVDAARWNSVFGGLLPKPVRDAKVLADPDAPDAALLATRLADVDALHPVFRVFRLPGGETVQNVLAYQYLLLMPEATSEARVVASFGDGAPALVERSIGQGRVMLWTTTLDLDWTDLPIRTAYLPLVRRLMDYLARRAGDAGVMTEVGDTLTLDVASLGADRILVEAPSGARTVLVVEAEGVRFTPAELGVHRVFAAVGDASPRPVPELTFASNPARAEMSMERMDPARLAAWSEAVRASGSGDDARGIEAGERPVWPALLFVLLIVIYLETLVSVRRRVWQRLRALWPG